MPRLIDDAELAAFLGAKSPRPPREMETSTDPLGLVRLTVPHDPRGNTCEGVTSAYCTTLGLTPERWAEAVGRLCERSDAVRTAVIARLMGGQS